MLLAVQLTSPRWRISQRSKPHLAAARTGGEEQSGGGKMLLVREHPTVRVNKFHPLHKTNPVDTTCLGDARCTIAFDVENGVER